MRVLIADDHYLVREGLKALLASEEAFEVVAEASTGTEAARLAAEHQPDVVILDLRMPGGDGIEACRRIKADCPSTHVMMLSTFDDDVEAIYEALNAGASSYLLKDVFPEKLIQSLRAVDQGQTLLHPEIAWKVFGGRPLGEKKRAEKLVEELSEREREVLELMAKGLKNRQIAGNLWITEKTVKAHVGKILRKLGQEDRTQAVVFAFRNGLVSA